MSVSKSAAAAATSNGANPAMSVCQYEAMLA